jgi:peptidoglycan hydrolase-like protein with peptidoglycan-binding domain
LRALRKRALIAVLAAGALVFAPDSHAASVTAKKSAPAKSPGTKSSTTKKKSVVKSGAKPTSRKPSYKPRRTRSRPFRYRLARLKLQPERITEIQRALGQAGYLGQEPNGQWDDATRNAMRRYQQENGFPDTGLPEAKSLMKLGLGPHPLPEELDSTAQAAPAASPLPGAESADPSLPSSPSQSPRQ